jgi:hypothetical protein
VLSDPEPREGESKDPYSRKKFAGKPSAAAPCFSRGSWTSVQRRRIRVFAEIVITSEARNLFFLTPVTVAGKQQSLTAKAVRDDDN